MSAKKLNALQWAVATLVGALVVIVGLQSVERGAAQREIERSAEVMARAIAERLNGNVLALARGIELAIVQGVVGAGPEAQAAIDRWAKARPAYAAIFVVSPSGRVLAATPQRLVGRDVSYEPWFENTRKGTAVTDTSGRGIVLAGGGAESIVTSPLRGANGEFEGAVVVAPGERWYADAITEAKRSLAGFDPGTAVTILSAGGSLLYRERGSVPETGGATAEASAWVTGTDALAGWTTTVRAPLAPAGAVWAVPWPLVRAMVASALVMALIGWWIGSLVDASLVRIAEATGIEPDGEEGRAGPDRLLQQVTLLREREAQAQRAGRDARAALDRTSERLEAFQIMSGWTYWSVDLAAATATWTHVARGADRTNERTMTIDAVTAYVLAEDRAILDMTLQSASEESGVHDIELRLTGAGREGKRLLVRLERATDEPGRSGRLHALTRETSAESIRGVGALALSQPVAAERRQTSMLRPVVDSVIHDFNNILTLAMSNLDALGPREGERTLLERTMRALRRGAGLTNRMVAFVRQQIPSVHSASVADVVEGLRPFLAASLPPTARLAAHFAPHLPPVRCSDRQLELVLMNLVIHVQETAPADSRIRLEAVEEGAIVRMTITSEPSQHGYEVSESAPHYPGSREIATGIAAVTALLIQVGGTLGEREQQGRLAFDIVLPAAEPEVPRPAMPAASIPTARILIVDSDALMRATLSDALRGMGHLVAEARSGADAMGRLSKGTFDIMLTEQGLPVMTGLQLAATARRMMPGLKIVISSARGQLPRSADAFLVLDKPFGRAELAHVLAQPTPTQLVRDAA